MKIVTFPGTAPCEVAHDGNLAISIGNSRKDVNWRNREITWGVLVGKLKDSLKTRETHAQFMKMSPSQQGTIKDVGGFVGGYVKDGRRLKENITERQILTLDADHVPKDTDFADLVFDAVGDCVGFVIYSTHKHTPEAPRLRLVIPMIHPVSPEEYEAIARKIAEKMGIDLFDDTTYEPHRLMYWPSHSADSDPYFYFYDEGFLDPDVILSEYPDWRDTSFWPYSSRVGDIRKKQTEKAGDPLEKPGIIGAFNRTYTVPDAIERFLPDIYTPCDTPGRYTYAAGTTAAGLVVYQDGLFAYSNHSTDPAGSQLCNAFDLVRIHKFGDKDTDADMDKPINKKASFKAMQDFARNDPETKRTLIEDKEKGAVLDFSGDLEAEDKDWVAKLDAKKDGSLATNARNALLILMNDERLREIRYNAMSMMIEAPVDSLPWKRDFISWQNVDTDQLYMWVANNYEVQFPKELFSMALNTVASHERRRFNPVEDFLDSLPEWDGKERAAGLLVECLGAEDNAFTREALVKVMLAAVARIREPGTKFDHMLILNGPQGIGKSTFFELLFRGFLSDSLTMTDMKDKTGSEKLLGFWAVEVAEMTGMRKAEVESVKGFITRREDVFRPAYGRVVERHPRRCVIVGSTNSSTGFLRDVTGNRRFWPVRCWGGKRKPWEIPDEEIDQTWAEILRRYEAGESLLLSPEAEEIAMKKQREALEEDPRQAQVEEYLNKPIPANWAKITDINMRRDILSGDIAPEGDVIDRESVSNIEIWCECFGRRREEMERKDADAITAIMTKMEGWERQDKPKRISVYGVQRSYTRVTSNEEFSNF